jgi:hypothetical protein
MLAAALTILGIVTTPATVGHIGAVIQYLRPALASDGGAARLYYAGECRDAENDPSGVLHLLFPPVNLQRPLDGATGMPAVQEIFRDDPHVTVTEDQSGIPRVTVGSVNNAVLQTTLPLLTLDPTEQYTAPSAVDKIAITADLYAKAHGLPFGLAPFVIDHIANGPVTGAPHLPETMRNVTIDGALDAVARTFKGIVMYGVCKLPDGRELFKLDYIYGPR